MRKHGWTAYVLSGVSGGVGYALMFKVAPRYDGFVDLMLTILGLAGMLYAVRSFWLATKR